MDLSTRQNFQMVLERQSLRKVKNLKRMQCSWMILNWLAEAPMSWIHNIIIEGTSTKEA
jgi:hypothetical protein